MANLIFDEYQKLSPQANVILSITRMIAQTYHMRDSKNCIKHVEELEEQLEKMDNLVQLIKEDVLENTDPHEN